MNCPVIPLRVLLLLLFLLRFRTVSDHTEMVKWGSRLPLFVVVVYYQYYSSNSSVAGQMTVSPRLPLPYGSSSTSLAAWLLASRFTNPYCRTCDVLYIRVRRITPEETIAHWLLLVPVVQVPVVPGSNG